MNPIDLVYLQTVTAMLDDLRCERGSADAAGDRERSLLLQNRIDQLLFRRQQILGSMFEVVPAIAMRVMPPP